MQSEMVERELGRDGFDVRVARSVGELRMLAEVSQAVNKTLDLETVLSTIAAKAVQLSNTDVGAITSSMTLNVYFVCVPPMAWIKN